MTPAPPRPTLFPSTTLFRSPIILLIVVFGGLQSYRRWQQRKAGGEEQQAYYRVKPLDRALERLDPVVSLLLLDRKSKRLNSSHANTLYAVFSFKKKN